MRKSTITVSTLTKGSWNHKEFKSTDALAIKALSDVIKGNGSIRATTPGGIELDFGHLDYRCSTMLINQPYNGVKTLIEGSPTSLAYAFIGYVLTH